MAYAQRFGLSRNSPLLNVEDGKLTTNTTVPKDIENPASNIINQNNVKKDSESKGWGSWLLDRGQDVLSVAGMVPGLGAIPDALNTAVSGGRLAYNTAIGDKAGMKEAGFNLALNAAAIIPGAGQAATAAKFANRARKSIKGADKVLDVYKGVDSAIASSKVVKGIKNIGAKGKRYVKNAQPLYQNDNALTSVGKKAFNFATQKKGLVPKTLQKGIINKYGKNKTAHLLSKGLDKSTSAIGITKFGKMGVAGEGVQNTIQSAYKSPKSKDGKTPLMPGKIGGSKNAFGPIPKSVLVSGDPRNKDNSNKTKSA